MTPQAKRTTLLFALLQGFYWSSYCMLYAFLITILTGYGFTTLQAGIAMTLISVVTIIAQPLLGYISDTFLPAKRLLIFCMAIGAGLTLLLPTALSSSKALGLSLVLLISVFDYSIYTVIDVWIVRTIAKNPGMEFAVMRSGGSVLYASTALLMGNLLASTGVRIMLTGHTVMLLAAIGVACFLEEFPCPNSASYAGSALVKKGEGGLLSAARQLMHNRTFVVVVCSLTLHQISARIGSTYLATLVEYFGGTSREMGLAIFIGSGLEFVVMLVVGRILQHGKCSLTTAYFLFNILAVTRFALLLLPGDIRLLLVTQVFHSLFVGTYLRVFTEYIAKITPPHLTATACTLAIAASVGVGCVPGNLFGGLIIERFGMHSYIWFCVIIAIVATLVFVPNLLAERRKTASTQNQPGGE